MGEIYISEIIKESDLTHYGVKGMHWGIRKDRGSSASRTANSIRDMADADLQKVVNRMRLEQQYRDMTANPAVKTGKKQVAKYANQTLNLVISTALTATIGAAVKGYFANGGGIPTFGGQSGSPPPVNLPPVRPRGVY